MDIKRETIEYFEKINKLSTEDFTPGEFKELMQDFDYVPGLHIVEFFENFEVPKFYNPYSWVLEECFKMLIQQDTE